MNKFVQKLGYYATTRRLVLRLRATDVANQLNLTRQGYYNFESGKSLLSSKLLSMYCNLLHIQIDDFIAMNPNPIDFMSNGQLDPVQISKNLIFIRKGNGFTQKELSEKIGCDKKTIHKYEHNQLPTILYLKDFCCFFEIKPSYILYGDVYEDRLKKYSKFNYFS